MINIFVNVKSFGVEKIAELQIVQILTAVMVFNFFIQGNVFEIEMFINVFVTMDGREIHLIYQIVINMIVEMVLAEFI